MLPRGYKEPVPAGYIPVRFKTYNGYSIMRAIPATTAPADVAKAMDLVKKTRVYRLAPAANPPPQRYIDMAGKLFDGIARFDVSFYESLARMAQEEPVQPRDLVAMVQLRSLGIEKGKPFQPDAAMRDILGRAVVEARAGFIRTNYGLAPFRVGTRWAVPVGEFGHQTTFRFHDGQRFALDERGAFFFLGCAPPVMASSLDVPFSYSEPVRDHHATGRFPVSYPIPHAFESTLLGKRVAIVNDVINAGSAVRGTLASLRQCGARPVAIGTLAVYGAAARNLAATHDVALETLASFPSRIWEPSACPLCSKGVPLNAERPSS